MVRGGGSYSWYYSTSVIWTGELNDIAEFLLQLGCDPYFPDMNGDSAFHYCVRGCNLKYLKTLHSMFGNKIFEVLVNQNQFFMLYISLWPEQRPFQFALDRSRRKFRWKSLRDSERFRMALSEWSFHWKSWCQCMHRHHRVIIKRTHIISGQNWFNVGMPTRESNFCSMVPVEGSQLSTSRS